MFLLFFLLFSSVSTADPRNLILFTIDTLRADSLSCNGSTKVQTPNIDRLAGGGVNFLRVRTAVPLTLPAHTSILTALYPSLHGVRDNGTFVLAQDKLTLAEVLKQHGYTTAAFVGSFVLDHRFGLAQGFDVYDDRITRDPAQIENLDAERNAGAVAASLATWLDSYKQKGPLFLWIHLYDPHAPYIPPEPYRTKYQQNPYAGEVAYTDAIVGKILQQLQARKLTDNSIIALVGDHGEALGEHEETTHAVLIYNSTLHVPMMISAPGLVKPGLKIDSLCRTIDLAPTLLDYLNISDKLGEGVSWRSAIEHGSPPAVVASSESMYAKLNLGWSELQGIETERYHYILSPKPELYDTRNDPAELKNLIEALPAVARDLRQKLESTLPRAAAKPQPLDEETKEKLSSLGYVSGSASPPGKSSSVNPRDKMAVSNRIQFGIAELTKGNLPSAAQTFQNILTTEQDIPLLYDYLGLCYMRLERLSEARKVYEAAIKRGIDSSRFRMNLGIIDTKERDYGHGQPELEKAIQMDPLNVTAYFHLADLLRMKGQPDRAVEYYTKALEINPDFVYAVNGLGMAYSALNNDDKALQYFREAVQMQPQNPPGYFNLAVELEHTGRVKEAVTTYRKFLDLSAGKEFGDLRKRAADALSRLEKQ